METMTIEQTAVIYIDAYRDALRARARYAGDDEETADQLAEDCRDAQSDLIDLLGQWLAEAAMMAVQAEVWSSVQ